MDIVKERTKFLEEFLKNATFDGWTDKTIEYTCEKLGLDTDFGYILFPNGIDEICTSFAKSIDDKMEKYLQKNPILVDKIRDKIHFLIMLRLKYYTPYKESISKLVRSNYNPRYVIRSAKMLWKTADNFWHHIGDDSTDFNYYSKRFLLSCVYSRSLLYWLSDESEEYNDTKLFVEKRITEVLKIGGLKRKFEKIKKLPFIRLLFKPNRR